MKHLYAAPQMEMICVEDDVIRTSSPISLFTGGEGKVQDEEKYDFSIFG